MGETQGLAEADFGIAKIVPPAFAGILVDWSIGAREITATIVDLAIRGFFGVEGSKIFLTGKKTGLKNFENNFIQKLFEDNNSLEFEEVEKNAYKKNFSDLIKIICSGMIEEDFVDKNFQKKLARAIKKSAEELYGGKFKKEKIPKEKILVLPNWLERIFRFFFIGLTGPIERKALEKLGGSYSEFLLTKKGKEAKARLFALKNFLEKFPLLDERLANELLAHAIAFGTGKKWMSKLGGQIAQLRNLAEKLDNAASTTMKFVDMDSYMKEFFIIKE